MLVKKKNTVCKRAVEQGLGREGLDGVVRRWWGGAVGQGGEEGTWHGAGRRGTGVPPFLPNKTFSAIKAAMVVCGLCDICLPACPHFPSPLPAYYTTSPVCHMDYLDRQVRQCLSDSDMVLCLLLSFPFSHLLYTFSPPYYHLPITSSLLPATTNCHVAWHCLLTTAKSATLLFLAASHYLPPAPASTGGNHTYHLPHTFPFMQMSCVDGI